MIALQDIKSADWQPKLGELGLIVEGVDDINQYISTILATPKGSVPHRPLFGSNIHKYVDYPIDEAVPHIVRETIDAISLWERRIQIKRIHVEIVDEQINVSVEWQLKESNRIEMTVVRV